MEARDAQVRTIPNRENVVGHQWTAGEHSNPERDRHSETLGCESWRGVWVGQERGTRAGPREPKHPRGWGGGGRRRCAPASPGPAAGTSPQPEQDPGADKRPERPACLLSRPCALAVTYPDAGRYHFGRGSDSPLAGIDVDISWAACLQQLTPDTNRHSRQSSAPPRQRKWRAAAEPTRLPRSDSSAALGPPPRCPLPPGPRLSMRNRAWPRQEEPAAACVRARARRGAAWRRNWSAFEILGSSGQVVCFVRCTGPQKKAPAYLFASCHPLSADISHYLHVPEGPVPAACCVISLRRRGSGGLEGPGCCHCLWWRLLCFCP
jgi:hypothetical protein